MLALYTLDYNAIDKIIQKCYYPHVLKVLLFTTLTKMGMTWFRLE